jgi:hypothetical protein
MIEKHVHLYVSECVCVCDWLVIKLRGGGGILVREEEHSKIGIQVILLFVRSFI